MINKKKRLQPELEKEPSKAKVSRGKGNNQEEWNRCNRKRKIKKMIK